MKTKTVGTRGGWLQAVCYTDDWRQSEKKPTTATFHFFSPFILTPSS
jgi:hypothetical protein